MLSGQGLGAIGAWRFQASNGFVEQMFGGCAAFDAAGAATDPANCGWARVIGGEASQDDTPDADGYRATAGVFQLGMQRQIAEHWYVSGALAYEMSQVNSNDGSTRVSGDSLLGGLYLRYTRGGLQVSGAIDAGYGWFDSKRSVGIGAISGLAQGNPEAWHAGFHARAAWQSAGTGGYVKPFVDFHAVHAETSAFTERGLATFGLTVESAANTALAGGAGIEIGSRLPLPGGGFVRPFASAAYQLLGNNDWDTTARFTEQPQGPAFNVATPAPDQLGRFAVGIDVTGSPTVDVSFQYTPVIGSGYVSHAGAARLSVRF